VENDQFFSRELLICSMGSFPSCIQKFLKIEDSITGEFILKSIMHSYLPDYSSCISCISYLVTPELLLSKLSTGRGEGDKPFFIFPVLIHIFR
jgi:hypothetical protein